MRFDEIDDLSDMLPGVCWKLNADMRRKKIALSVSTKPSASRVNSWSFEEPILISSPNFSA
jgi:hypothetical protein